MKTFNLVVIIGILGHSLMAQEMAFHDSGTTLMPKNTTLHLVTPTNSFKTTDIGLVHHSFSYESGSEEICTSAPRINGRSYKIQFTSNRGFVASTDQFKNLEPHGTLYFEYLYQNKSTRYLIGDYSYWGDAEYALEKVWASGFQHAFIVEYKDGLRVENK